MQRRWVIPDIHGFSKTLKALVNDLIRPTRYDRIYFLGDYIDRGPDSRGVIDFIRSLKEDEYDVVAMKGNHEDVMVDLYDASLLSKNRWWGMFSNKKNQVWVRMGGKATLRSFGATDIRQVPTDYIDWMRNLPLYAIDGDYILVHAGLNCKADDPFADTRSMLWLRDYEIIPEKISGRKIIHGHVPVNMELIAMSIINKSYRFIDLDNGPYLQGKPGFGNLVALELNSMEMVIQDNLDI